MNNTLLRVCSVLAIVIGLVSTLNAKGQTVKLTVTGPTLSQPITITDAAVLNSSGVFDGSFVGATSVEPDKAFPRYRVFFHVELPQWMKAGVQIKYGVVYALNPRTGDGFVYLPGKGEEGYRLNSGTMLRDGHDGVWHRAPSSWATALNRYL